MAPACGAVVVLSYCRGEGGSKDLDNGPHNKRSRHCLVVVVVVVLRRELERQKDFMLLAECRQFTCASYFACMLGTIAVAPSVFGRVDAKVST